MANYLYHMVFQRGPMPFVSIGVSIVAIILLVTIRPRDSRTYIVLLAVCLLPLLAGAEGYRNGLAMVEAGWQQFIAANPAKEEISSARYSYTVGRMVSRDPFILGLALSAPLVVINTLMYLIMRKKN